MALEAGDGFISGLVATNPVNASDQVAQGDDHIRLIKTAIKGTFPNLNGAVNCTPAQLNVLATDGAGAGILANLAAIADPGADVLFGWDESANDAIAFTLGTGLTSSGTSVLINLAASLTWTGAYTQSRTSPVMTFIETDAAADNQVWQVLAGAAEQFVIRLLNDALSVGTPFLTVDRTGTTVDEMQYDATLHDINGNVDISGTLTTPNSSASEVGFKGTPFQTQNGDYTLVLADAGKTIYKASGGAGETITIPANGSVAFPVGTQIDIVNNGGGALTIAITTDTLSWVVSGTTGSRTLSDHGWAVLKKVASTEWFISGAGLT